MFDGQVNHLMYGLYEMNLSLSEGVDELTNVWII